MNPKPTTSDVAYGVFGAILDDPLWVIVRIVPWVFVAIAMPIWLAAVLLIGVLLGPYFFHPIIGALHQFRWVFDGVLVLLVWVSVHRVIGSWIAATLLVAAYLGLVYWKGALYTRRTTSPIMSIFKPSETTIDPTTFVHRIVALTTEVLACHGWTQRNVLRNETELKRFQYKARLEPRGLLEVTCFDEGFPGDATYPFPLLGFVDIAFDLPDSTATTVEAIFDEIYAQAQTAFPGVSRSVLERS